MPFRSYSPAELEQAIDVINADLGFEYKLTLCQALIAISHLLGEVAWIKSTDARHPVDVPTSCSG